MTRSDTTSETDDEELPEQCVAVAEETGERCGNPALPFAARCHAHVDYAELAADDPHGEDTGATPHYHPNNPSANRRQFGSETTGAEENKRYSP